MKKIFIPFMTVVIVWGLLIQPVAAEPIKLSMFTPANTHSNTDCALPSTMRVQVIPQAQQEPPEPCDEIRAKVDRALERQDVLYEKLADLGAEKNERQGELTDKCPEDLSIMSCVAEAVDKANAEYDGDIAELQKKFDDQSVYIERLNKQLGECTSKEIERSLEDLNDSSVKSTNDSDSAVIADAPNDGQPPSDGSDTGSSNGNSETPPLDVLTIFATLLSIPVLAIGKVVTEIIVGVANIVTGKFFADLATVIRASWDAGATTDQRLLNVVGSLWSLIDPFTPIYNGLVSGFEQMKTGFATNNTTDIVEGGSNALVAATSAIALSAGTVAGGRALLKGAAAKEASRSKMLSNAERVTDEISSAGQVASNAQEEATKPFKTESSGSSEAVLSDPTEAVGPENGQPEKFTLRARIEKGLLNGKVVDGPGDTGNQTDGEINSSNSSKEPSNIRQEYK